MASGTRSGPDQIPDTGPSARRARRFHVEAPWAHPASEVETALGVAVDQGLTSREAADRLSVVGPNQLQVSRPTRWWEILGRQLRSLVVVLLGAAALVSFLFGETIEAGAVVAVLAINTLLGFVAELRAVRSMESLRQLGRSMTRVRRDGSESMLSDEELVPGDIVLLEGGDRIAADLRVLDSAQLQVDESILTGESLPVDKEAAAISPQAELHARTSMLHRGTTVTHGNVAAVVVGTGMRTELGRIAALVESAEEEVTPLEERLDELGRRLVFVTVGIAAVATLAGIATGKPLLLMVQTGIALAVAAIPEGLPIVATIALARGMWRMARRNALVNHLSTVETLGSTTVILTDKTGTLTENQLAVETVVTAGGSHELPDVVAATDPEPVETLRLGALCNDASLTESGEGVGDPLEVALLEAARDVGIDVDDVRASNTRVREVAFDSDTRMMATFHRDDDGLFVAVKGAAEEVLDRCLEPGEDLASAGSDSPADTRLLAANDALAARGYRVLAVATKRVAHENEEPYEGLTFVGLVGLLDPPRSEVVGAVEACRTAGIDIVMLTGDQALTAAHIAKEVGVVADHDPAVVLGRDIPELESLPDSGREKYLRTRIFARVDPAQKLDLVALHQSAGGVVAMTGDGVNDAPALKKADIGVAMGQRGTQVARDAADMVLTDDSFASIVAAAHQGRVIFGNIRRFVVYLMSCNVSEILIVSGAVAANAPLPLLPLQILFLNLVTDVFPALALALGEGDAGLMQQPPRDPQEPVLSRAHWMRIIGFSLLISAATLAAMAISIKVLGYSGSRAVTVSFATLALAQLWHVFNLRDRTSSTLRNDVVSNPWVWGALALCTGLLVAAIHLPGLSRVLGTTAPGLEGWGVILTMSLVPCLLGQAWISRRR